MAKKATEKSAGRKAMEAGKKLLADAKTEQQTKAANAAIDAAKATLKIENAAKFKELASKRVSKALSSIAGVGKLANPRAYSFDADIVAKIEKALTDEVAACVKRYKSALTGAPAAAASGFSL